MQNRFSLTAHFRVLPVRDGLLICALSGLAWRLRVHDEVYLKPGESLYGRPFDEWERIAGSETVDTLSAA